MSDRSWLSELWSTPSEQPQLPSAAQVGRLAPKANQPARAAPAANGIANGGGYGDYGGDYGGSNGRSKNGGAPANGVANGRGLANGRANGRGLANGGLTSIINGITPAASLPITSEGVDPKELSALKTKLARVEQAHHAAVRQIGRQAAELEELRQERDDDTAALRMLLDALPALVGRVERVESAAAGALDAAMELRAIDQAPKPAPKALLAPAAAPEAEDEAEPELEDDAERAARIMNTGEESWEHSPAAAPTAMSHQDTAGWDARTSSYHPAIEQLLDPSLADKPRKSKQRKKRQSLLAEATQVAKALRSTFGRIREQKIAEPTHTIHEWAVTLSLDPDSWIIVTWGSAFVSCALVCLQMVVLAWVQLESSYPTCSAHDQCPLGMFCRSEWEMFSVSWMVPWSFRRSERCLDCAMTKPATTLNGSSILPTISAANSTVFACPDAAAVLGEMHHQSTKITGWDPKLDLFPWDAENVDHMVDWLKAPGYMHDSNTSHCLAAIHCENTDKWPTTCDHLRLITENLHWTNIVVLVVVALLLAGPLNGDMDQAAIESALLEHGLNQIEKRHEKFDFLKALKWPALNSLRLSLWLRRHFLPWCATMSAVAVLVASPLDSANVLLNVLAVTFILEADDMFATIVLTPKQIERAGALVKYVKYDPPWLEVRIIATSCAIALVLMVSMIEEVMSYLNGIIINVLATATTGSYGALEENLAAIQEWHAVTTQRTDFIFNVDFVLIHIYDLYPFNAPCAELRLALFLYFILMALIGIGLHSLFVIRASFAHSKSRGEAAMRILFEVLIELSYDIGTLGFSIGLLRAAEAMMALHVETNLFLSVFGIVLFTVFYSLAGFFTYVWTRLHTHYYGEEAEVNTCPIEEIRHRMSTVHHLSQSVVEHSGSCVSSVCSRSATRAPHAHTSPERATSLGALDDQSSVSMQRSASSSGSHVQSERSPSSTTRKHVGIPGAKARGAVVRVTVPQGSVEARRTSRHKPIPEQESFRDV